MNISNEILEQEQSAENYLPWVKSLIARVKVNEGGTESIRLRTGLSKVVTEEALPIGYFTKSHYRKSPDVLIKLKIGNQHYDALVNDKRENPSPIERIEVTSSLSVGSSNGYEDYLFKLHLHTTGMSGTGDITSSGTKNTGLTTNLDRKMVSQQSVLEHEKKTIQEAINRKLKNTDHYETNTALVISFDDVFAFNKKENITNLENVLDLNIDTLREHNFSLVAIVGLNNDLFIERRIRNV